MNSVRIRITVGAICSLGLAGAATFVAASPLSDMASQLMKQPAAQSALSDGDIAGGLKEALAKGVKVAINQLGSSGGFWDNPQFRIPLPGPIEKIEGLLKGAGMSSQVDDLHLQMNRAAEKAVPVAADVFSNAVNKLTLDDVRGILNGPSDAATQYFKRTTSDELTTKFLPVVSSVTAKTGLVQQYNGLVAKAGPMASLMGDKGDVNSYVTKKALDGLFTRVGQEEKSIRSDPAARTTDLMKKVFGSK